MSVKIIYFLKFLYEIQRGPYRLLVIHTKEK